MRALIIIILTVVTLGALADEDFVNALLAALGEPARTQGEIDDGTNGFGPPAGGGGPPIVACTREESLRGTCGG